MSRILTLCSLIVFLSFGLVQSAEAKTTSGMTKIKGAKDTDYGKLGRRYGPIKSADTLWRIAAKITPDDRLSVYKVMYALYIKNPQSFLDENYNHLKNDTYLKLPSIREIKRINLDDARKKAELDDELWAAKQRGELTPGKVAQAKEQIKNVKKSDLQEIKVEIKDDITSLQTEQTKQFDELKQKLIQNTEEMTVERDKNKVQQERLDAITDTLQTMKEQAAKEQAELLAALQAMAEADRERERKRLEDEKSGVDLAALWQQLTENPLYWGSALTLLVILSFVTFIIKAIRKKKKAQNQDEDSLFETPAAPVAQAPAAQAASVDDAFLPEDITNDSFSLDDVDESLTTLDDDLLAPEEDDIIHLDDTDDLDSDSLYEEDEPTLDEDDSLDGMLAQTDLDDLLSDEDFDLLGEDDDDLSGTDDMESMLDSDDMDDLLNMAEDGDDAPGSDDDINLDAAFDIDMSATDDEDGLDSLLTSDANESVTDDTDIDDILAQAQGDSEPAGAQIESNDVSDDDLDEIELDIPEDRELDLMGDNAQVNMPADDVDALMDELAQPSTVTDDDDIDALLDAAQDDSANVDSDDIDSLLDSASVEEPDEDFDIDALLDEAVEAPSSDDSAEEDDFDIDALLDETAADEPDDSPSSIDEDFDIDALLDEAVVDEPDDSPSSIDEDFDIDALLNEAQVDTPEDKPDPVDEDVDIDALLDEAGVDVPPETPVPADEDVDIDALLNEAGVDAPPETPVPADEDVDIDALLNEAGVDAPQDEPDPVDEDVDIDALLDEAGVDTPQETPAPADEDVDIDALLDETVQETPNPVDDEDDMPDDIDEDFNIDALLDETATGDDGELQSVVDDGDLDIGALLEQTSSVDEVEGEVKIDPTDSEDKLEKTSDEIVHEEPHLDDMDALIDTTTDDVPLGDLDSVIDTPTEEVPIGDLELDLETDDTQTDVETDSTDELDDEEELPDLALSDNDPDLLTDDDEAVESPSQALEQYPQLSIDDSVDMDDIDLDDIDLDGADDVELDATDAKTPEISADFDLDDIDLDSDDDIAIDTTDAKTPEISADFDLDDIDLDSDDIAIDTVDAKALEINADFDLDDIDLESADDLDSIDELSLTDEKPDEDVQALDDLESSDFDDILSGIATEDDLELPQDLDIAQPAQDIAEEEIQDDVQPVTVEEVPEDFVGIDSLLEDSGENPVEAAEPYDAVKMDVGLGEFDSLMGDNEKIDVDAQDGGYSAQLDLAKGYLEIGDEENALATLETVLADGPAGVKEEANALLSKIMRQM